MCVPLREPSGHPEAASAWPLVGMGGDEGQGKFDKVAGRSERREELS